jgi:aspartate 1-decarboxylase
MIYRILLRSKIHRARVTQADLDYEGSIAIDQDLLERAGIAPYEKVEIYDITNGNRLETYAIVGRRGSGEICVNGAAARLVRPNDLIIICCYGLVTEPDVSGHQARIILVDENNRPLDHASPAMAGRR